MKNNILLFVLILPLLAACSSGGGSSNISPNGKSPTTVKPVLIDSYEPLTGEDYMAIDDIYVQDLTLDGVEEVVIAGRLTQPSTIEDWQEYDMQIYGWNSGSFTNETVKWFDDKDNRILGTEPAVKFGDFNGDGNVDMGVAHGTDMDYYGPSYVYFNSGEEFSERVSIEHSELWGHDAAVADFNDDGYDDFLIGSLSGSGAGYNIALALGSKDNSFRTIQADSELGNTSGVGLATGDFLNDGSVTVVATGGSKEQELYSLDFSGSKLEMDRISVLPDSRFELSKWDDERANARYKDTVRVLAFDFNNDGIDDVVSFSTLGKNGRFHGYTEVQFIENDGSGNFTDVTDEVLKEFDTEQVVSYNPRLVDVNGDGLLDIMMSEVTTSVLLQQDDGSFVERFKEDFDAYNQTIREQIAGQADGAEPENAIVTGPDGAKFLVSKVNQINDFGGFEENKIFLSEIGNDGTITVTTTVSALKEQWPWMTDEQASEILSLTASGSVDGVPVIDYTQAMAPIGGLSLKVDSGKWFNQIKGHVSGINLTEQVSVLAQDNTSRTFAVDLSTSVFTTESTWSSFVDNKNQTDYTVQSSNLINGESFSSHGITIQQDNNMSNYRISLPSVVLNKNAFLTASFTDLDFSPWLSMSGMWGSINKTNITEGTLTFKKENWVVNAGVMHTSTDITPGLITSVNDIYAVWSDVGWQHEDNNFGFYGGVDPVVVSGSVSVSLPDSVDNEGNLIYNESTVPLISEKSFYIRAFFNKNIHNNLDMKTSAVVRNSGKTNVSMNFQWNF